MREEPQQPTTEERIQEAVKSPKTPPILLTLGSIIWKIIAAWSNVDFILSVREERIAMILELAGGPGAGGSENNQSR
jgi:hypothetical protein